MYPFVLTVHSWNRWVVLLAAAAALVLAWRGWLGGRRFGRPDHAAGATLTGALHLQLLLGLWLYSSLSPWPRLAWQQGRGLWSDATLRFWGVEHIGLMVAGVVLAQVGRSLSKRAPTDALKHRRAAVFYTLAVLIILLGVPFASRPWFRF